MEDLIPRSVSVQSELSMELVSQKLTELSEQIAQGPIAHDPDSMLQVVETMQAVLPLLERHEQGRWHERLGEAFDQTPERVRRIIEMSQVADIRRALICRPWKQPLEREPGEEVYPTTGWLGRWLKTTSGTECPLAYFFWTGVAAVGCAARRRWWFDRGDHNLYLNTYMILVGPTAIGKSTAINAASDLMRRCNFILSQRGIDSMEQIQLMPQKVSPERLVTLLVRPKLSRVHGARVMEYWPDAIGWVAVDELVTMLGKEVYNSRGMIDLLTALWSQDVYDASTFTRGDEKLHNVALTFLGGTTPDWIRTSVTPELFGGGFMGRCMFLYRDRGAKIIPFRSPRDPIAIEDLAEQLAAWATGGGCLKMTPTALKNYGLWYASNKRGAESCGDDWLRAYYSRKDSAVMKLAGILAMSDEAGDVDQSHLEHALEILKFEEGFFLTAFEQMSTTQNALLQDMVLSYLGRSPIALQRSTVWRDLRHRFKEMREFDDVMTALIDSDLVLGTRVATTRGGCTTYGITEIGRSYMRAKKNLSVAATRSLLRVQEDDEADMHDAE